MFLRVYTFRREAHRGYNLPGAGPASRSRPIEKLGDSRSAMVGGSLRAETVRRDRAIQPARSDGRHNEPLDQSLQRPPGNNHGPAAHAEYTLAWGENVQIHRFRFRSPHLELPVSVFKRCGTECQGWDCVSEFIHAFACPLGAPDGLAQEHFGFEASV